MAIAVATGQDDHQVCAALERLQQVFRLELAGAGHRDMAKLHVLRGVKETGRSATVQGSGTGESNHV
jgi:hypothetical protein